MYPLTWDFLSSLSEWVNRFSSFARGEFTSLDWRVGVSQCFMVGSGCLSFFCRD